MSVESSKILERDLEALYAKIFEQYQKTKDDLESYTDLLIEWMKTQKHLPETDNRTLVKKFLLLNKFSVERTKAKLDMYYTMRKLIPEMFQNPNTPKMTAERRNISILPLPKLSKNSNRIIVARLSEICPPSSFFCNESYANFFAVMEVLIKEDMVFELEAIVDHTHTKIEHIPRFDLVAMKKCEKVLEKVFSNRIAVIHIVNVPPYFVSVLNLIKKTLSPKLSQRINAHSDTTALHEYYSKDMLPVEMGGTGLSLVTLNDMWDKKFLEYSDRFEKLEKMEVDESLRPEPLKNDDILGWHGNFKKLDVD